MPLFLLSAAASCLMVLAVRRVARRHLLDLPNERSSHIVPTPRGGGLAIAILSIMGVLAFFPGREGWAIAASAAVVAVVSFVDDVRSVTWRIRLSIHAGTAIIVVAAVPMHASVPHPAWLALVSVASVIWIVGLTNAYNFMDGIDGIAGLQAVVAGVAWFILLRGVQPGLSQAALVAAGSAAGFLIHNIPRARIFMGDVGSAFLGFTIASIGVVAAQRRSSLAVAAVLIMWPFVFDSTFTLVRRLLRGERLYEAHRSHIYQRLVQTGVSHAAVAFLYASVACLGASAAVLLHDAAFAGAAVASCTTALAMLLVWLVTVKRERGESA